MASPTTRTIVERMVVRMLAADVPVTDFTAIAVVRILLEVGFSPEFKRLYDGLDRAQRDWFITTARHAALDRRLADYNFQRPPAELATGTLQVTVDANTEVPAGVAIETEPTDGSEPKRYVVAPNPSTPTGAWPIALLAGAGFVRIVAVAAGAAGNTAANTITFLRTAVAGVTAITNTQPLMGGRDAASDDEYVNAWFGHLASLTRGPIDALVYGIRAFVDANGARPVHSVAIVEWGGQTLLDANGRSVAMLIYIEDGTGTAGGALVDQVQALVDGSATPTSKGLRAGGCPAAVVSASPLPIAADVLIDAARAANPVSVRLQVEQAINEFVSRLPVGGLLLTGELQGQLVLSQLFRRVMDVPGVLRARFNAPTADFPIPIGMKAVPGAISVAVSSVS